MMHPANMAVVGVLTAAQLLVATPHIKPKPPVSTVAAKAEQISKQKQPQSTTAPSPAPTCALRNVPYNYAEYLCVSAKKGGITTDPALVAAIMFYEHRKFDVDPLATNWHALCSGAGACGAGQFMPRTWSVYGLDGPHIHDGDGGGDGKATRGDFADDVQTTANYIAAITGQRPQLTNDEVAKAAIHYNCGPACTMNRETADYVANVVPLWQNFKTY